MDSHARSGAASACRPPSLKAGPQEEQDQDHGQQGELRSKAQRGTKRNNTYDSCRETALQRLGGSVATQQASRVLLPGMHAHTKGKGPSESWEPRPWFWPRTGEGCHVAGQHWTGVKFPPAGSSHQGTLSWGLTPLSQKQAALLSRPPLLRLVRWREELLARVTGTAPTAYSLICHQDSQPRQKSPLPEPGHPGLHRPHRRMGARRLLGKM